MADRKVCHSPASGGGGHSGGGFVVEAGAEDGIDGEGGQGLAEGGVVAVLGNRHSAGRGVADGQVADAVLVVAEGSDSFLTFPCTSHLCRLRSYTRTESLLPWEDLPILILQSLNPWVGLKRISDSY